MNKHEKKKKRKERKLCTQKRNRMTEETEKKRTKRSFECWPGQSCPKYCHTFPFVFSLYIGMIQFG